MQEKHGKSRPIRCFIGITYKLCPAARKLYENLQQMAEKGSSRLRPVAEENLHITLKFLGSVDESQLAAIEHAMVQIAARHNALQLSPKGIGYFKNSIWIGVERSPALLGLAAELNLAFATLGFRSAEKAYVPHITMARFKDKASISLSELTTTFGDEIWDEFTANAITLYKSDTLSEGAKYTSLSKAELKQP